MARVHVVLADRGWVLERIGSELARRLEYVSLGDDVDPAASWNYYVNYTAFHRPGPTRDLAFFTHVEDAVPDAARRFFRVAEQVEHRICMSRIYADRLARHGLDDVHVIRPGVELETFTPKLRVGLAGPPADEARSLVASLADVGYLDWHAAADGWPVPRRDVDPRSRAPFYRSIDCLLVTSPDTDGSMAAVEAIACGKEVVAPDAGLARELPHVSYRAGDRDDLLRALRGLHQRQLEVREAVLESTWDRFAGEHDRLFREILPAEPPRTTVSVPSPDGASDEGDWTKRARALWPAYVDRTIDADRLRELARLWLDMRQPGAVAHLVERHADDLGSTARELHEELRSFELDGALLARRAEFEEISSSLAHVRAQMQPNERFHLFCCLEALDERAVCVELGSFQGGSTTLIGEYLRRRGGNTLFASVDVTKHDGYWEAMASTGLRDRVEHVVSRSDQAGLSLLQNGGQGTVDFLLVDADHRYEAVRDDIHAWMPMLRPGGIVAFHDHSGAPDPDIRDRYPHPLGVYDAVEESLERSPFRRLYFPLVRPLEPVWSDFPSIFSTIAAFRSPGAPLESPDSRRARFATALSRLASRRGDARPVTVAPRDPSAG